MYIISDLLSSTSGVKGKFFNININFFFLQFSIPVLSLNIYQPAFTVCFLNLLTAFPSFFYIYLSFRASQVYNIFFYIWVSVHHKFIIYFFLYLSFRASQVYNIYFYISFSVHHKYIIYFLYLSFRASQVYNIFFIFEFPCITSL